MTAISAGKRFRDAVAQEHPLQIVGAINANHALLATSRFLATKTATSSALPCSRV